MAKNARIYVLCPDCSIARPGPGFWIANINPDQAFVHWRCPSCCGEVVSLRPPTPISDDGGEAVHTGRDGG